MSGLGAPAARLALALLTLTVVVVPLVVAPLPVAVAAEATPRTYTGGTYAADLPLPPPTRTENQDKLWFHDDAWWALMLEPAGRSARAFQLLPDHTWGPTSAVINTDTTDVGDALHDGENVHVVTRRTDDSLFYVRLTYDAAARDYRAGTPVLVTTRGAQSPAAIAKDGAGRLWITFATASDLIVTHSDDGGQTWDDLRMLAATGTGQTPEMAAIVAYDDRVGVLWSNQRTGSLEFASHRNGDDPEAWSFERALQGPAQADNHISLKRVPGEPSDTLVAAVKTSRGDRGEAEDSPLLELLLRAPDGTWSKETVSTVADGLDNPVVQVDETTRTLHVFAGERGNIVTKATSVDDVRFEPGIGDLFVLGEGGGLAYPTVSKDPVDARSGMVVLASDPDTNTYSHAELPLTTPTPVPDPADTTPPTAPEAVQARAPSPEKVVLVWSESTDGDGWAPARQGIPVQGYVVLRNGVEVATVETTSFQDTPRSADDATAEATVEYSVVAVDRSGNRSSPASVKVVLPAAGSGTATATVVGVALLLLAGLAALLAVRRVRRIRNRPVVRKPQGKHYAKHHGGGENSAAVAAGRPPSVPGRTPGAGS
jgi:hypothetical protein